MPGADSTIAYREPTNLLNKVDFPTFGLPTIATKSNYTPIIKKITFLNLKLRIFVILNLNLKIIRLQN
jgi:hypothetical protein